MRKKKNEVLGMMEVQQYWREEEIGERDVGGRGEGGAAAQDWGGKIRVYFTIDSRVELVF